MTNSKKVIDIMLEWKNDPCYDGAGVWWGYNTLSELTNIPLKELKKIMKELARKKIVERKTTLDCEGNISGSGWFITDID